MAKIKKEETKAFTVNFPVSLVEEIDQMCAANYITRTSWLIKASKEFLANERRMHTEELIKKLSEQE